MADNRIYGITNIEGGIIIALVRAGNKSQALAHHARNTFGVAVASPEQLIEATKRGIEVEVAGEGRAE
jgi:hypothetical protein